MSRPPLIIIGAGRSGTNALRDALTSMNDFHTWPCDEINYIWRHGNRDYPTDELRVEHATPKVKAFIRRAFARRAAKSTAATLVEKTCANSLRLGFVHAIHPNAKFVIISRDPLDVVSSAIPRWSAPLDVSYLARKARWVPPGDLVHYAARYFRSRVSRSSNGKLSTWGPRFEGLDEMVAEGKPIHEICANQWLACIERIDELVCDIPDSQVSRVIYEDLATNPEDVLRSLALFSHQQPSESALKLAASSFRSTSVGAWRDRLTDVQADQILAICGRQR